MLQLGLKLKKNEKSKVNSFIWTIDEVQLLLKATMEIQNVKSHGECWLGVLPDQIWRHFHPLYIWSNIPHQIKNILIHRPHVIRFVAHWFIFFSTLESGFKYNYLDPVVNWPQMHVDAWKLYVERKSCRFKNNYMDMCGWDLTNIIYSF